jgi:uncharacterized membrane protein YoaK (UPF0700 family)
MSSDTRAPERWLSFGLSFIGGYGDAAGFVLAKTFTGHITGSLVLAAIALASHDWRGTLTRLAAVLCFLAGILSSVLIARTLRARPSWLVLPTAMGVEVILIVAAYWVLASHWSEGIEIFVACFSVALGLQNGAFRRAGGVSVHTTYLTGLITGLLTTEAEKFALEAAPRATMAATDPKFSLLCGIWFTFVLGAAAGAGMVLRFKELGILAAAMILLAIVAFHAMAAPRGHLAS